MSLTPNFLIQMITKAKTSYHFFDDDIMRMSSNYIAHTELVYHIQPVSRHYFRNLHFSRCNIIILALPFSIDKSLSLKLETLHYLRFNFVVEVLSMSARQCVQ